jgi:DnaJ domain
VGEVARVLSCTDYYEVLEVERTADEGAIRRAKRSKALLVHPDKLPGDASIGAAEAFHRITEVCSRDVCFIVLCSCVGAGLDSRFCVRVVMAHYICMHGCGCGPTRLS